MVQFSFFLQPSPRTWQTVLAIVSSSVPRPRKMLEGFRHLSFLQSERSQLGAGGLVICMKNASNPQTFRDLNEDRSVFDIDDVLRRRVGDVQRQSKDVRVGLADVNKAGGNKRVHKPVELKLPNPIRIHLIART
jgi:hypothetical protein